MHYELTKASLNSKLSSFNFIMGKSTKNWQHCCFSAKEYLPLHSQPFGVDDIRATLAQATSVNVEILLMQTLEWPSRFPVTAQSKSVLGWRRAASQQLTFTIADRARVDFPILFASEHFHGRLTENEVTRALFCRINKCYKL